MSRRIRRRRRAARRRTTAVLALATLTALAIAAVGVPGLSGGSAGAEGSTSAFASSGSASGSASGNRYSAGIDASIADIQQFWSSALPQVYGVRYKSIPSDRLIPYSAAHPPPSCDDGGQTTTTYEQVKGNAFYCSNGDFVAWDAQELIPKLQKQFGDFAVALVLAHEWGHAIQARTNTSFDATAYIELQADCFAGAWTKHVASGKDTSLRLGAGDLDTALGGYLVFRDPVGTDGGQSGAHGNAFDRVSAFQDGFAGGASACRDYESSPPQVTETGFTSQEDASSGGNAPLSDVEKLVTDDLRDYSNKDLGKTFATADVPKVVAVTSTSAAASCDGTSDGGVLEDGVRYCTGNNTISYDKTTFTKAYDDVGDFGAGMLLAAAWSSWIEHHDGQPIGSDTARSRADCLTGAWTGSVASGDRNNDGSHLALSAGDLDEAIRMFTLASRTGNDGRGSPFTRVDAFRTGFTQGAEACQKVTAGSSGSDSSSGGSGSRSGKTPTNV